MYFDFYYVLIVVPFLIISFILSRRVNRVFEKYNNQFTSRGVTGFQAARRVLDANGLQNVPIDLISGKLSDHYDPTANVVRLSDAVYNGTSSAAIGIACHEVGHAIQYSKGYKPVRFRMAIIPITNIGARISIPLLILGLILSSFSYLFIILAWVGLLFYTLSAVFQFATLFVEFDASKRALVEIQNYSLLNTEEINGAQQVLRAAALTYVAALAVTLSQIVRFILILRRR